MPGHDGAGAYVTHIERPLFPRSIAYKLYRNIDATTGDGIKRQQSLFIRANSVALLPATTVHCQRCQDEDQPLTGQIPLFQKFGNLEQARLVVDWPRGRPRGKQQNNRQSGSRQRKPGQELVWQPFLAREQCTW